MEILKEYLPQYANLFNRSHILNFINKIEANQIKELIKNSTLQFDDSLKYFEFFDYIYKILKQEYKCEYIYLNEIFINEILKNHSDDATILTELSVNSSKVDLLIVNGTTTAYEIKTELDSLQRLEKQLLDYIKVFDKVYIVTYLEFVDSVKELLKKNMLLKKVGIKILNDNGTLSEIKNSGSFIRNFDKNFIYNCLLKAERENLNKDYNKAKKKFEKYSKKKIHEYFKGCLIKRKKNFDFIENLPNSLKMIGYKLHTTLNKAQKEKLHIKLQKQIKF